MISSQEFQQIEDKRMEVIAQMDPNIMKCINKDCGTLIFLQPSAPDYKQKDETGKVISRKAADHMA